MNYRRSISVEVLDEASPHESLSRVVTGDDEGVIPTDTNQIPERGNTRGRFLQITQRIHDRDDSSPFGSATIL